MAGETHILANRLNGGKSTDPRTGEYAKQSQFREPRLPRRFAPRNDMRRQETDHAKQSQFPRPVGQEPRACHAEQSQLARGLDSC